MKKLLNNPLVPLVLLPFSSIIVGTKIGIALNSFQFYPFFLFYLFLLLSHLMEFLWTKDELSLPPSHLSLQKVLGILLAVILFLFSITVNLPVIFLLVVYVSYIYFMSREKLGMKKTIFYPVMQIFFQVFILNTLSFYIQANYVSLNVIPYLLPTALYLCMCLTFEQKDGFKRNWLQLMAVFYIAGLVVIAILFYMDQTSWVHPLTFYTSQVLLALPFFFNKFRQKVHTDWYLAVFVTLSNIVFALSVFM